MKWSDIPQFLHGGNYGCDVEMSYLGNWLDESRNYEGLELDPDFQRGHVWTDDQRSKYIEYTLRGGISSRVIYWNCPDYAGSRREPHCDLDGKLTIVDGKQRLTSMRMFIAGEIKAFGLRHGEFEGRTRIKQGSFYMQVNNLQTRKDVLTWYLELNDGGVVHSEEEIARVRALLDAETKRGSGL